jgi:tetratricopeptide (TPR) repeat protein
MSHTTITDTTGQNPRLARLLQLLSQDPRNARLRKDCVDMALAAKDFDSLLQAADTVLAIAPEDASARFDRATALIGKREYRAALDTLTPLQALEAESFGIRFNIALCHYCLSEFDAALPLLEECYARGLRDVGLLRLLVTSYHHVGRMEDAVRVATENPDPATHDAALAGAYALVYLDADDAARATRWANVALRLDPKSIDGRVTQGTLLIARVELPGATTMLQSVIDDAPQTARAWIGLGSLALLERNFDKARALLSRGVELMPNHVGSWHILGWTQLLQQDLPAAEASFERALELDRNFAETHGALAAIAALRGERGKAQQLIEIANRLDSDSLAARFAESVLTRQSADPAKAMAIIADAATGLGAKQQSALGKLLRRVPKPKG